MPIIKMHEAKTRLSQLVAQVQHGEEVVIARGSKPIAKLVPYTAPSPRRKPGFLKGKIKIAADFDAPLPEEVLKGFEGQTE